MITNIDFYLYVNNFNNCEKNSDDLILSVTKNSNNKLRDILVLSPNTMNSNFSFEEKKEYVENLVKQFDYLFENGMSEKEKKLYAIFLLKDGNLTQESIEYYEELNFLEFEKNSWQYTLKEYIQYGMLNYYLRMNLPEKLKKLTNELKDNNEIFKKLWTEMVQEAYKTVKE